jgi:hypothetical protein
MLQTIEVQIDYNGVVHSIDPAANKLPAGRAFLTLLEEPKVKSSKPNPFDDLFGILTASHSVSLEEMEQAIPQQGQDGFNDCN